MARARPQHPAGAAQTLDVCRISALYYVQMLFEAGNAEPEDAAGEAFDGTLRQLVHLTSLYLSLDDPRACLPALASLPRLQRLCIIGRGHEPASLPAGPWLSSLRELGTSRACLCSSSQVLAVAAQLERVAVMSGLSGKVRRSEPLFAWLSAHPPLRCLELHIRGNLHSGMRSAVAGLQQGRPELQVAFIGGSTEQSNFVTGFHTIQFF